MNAPRSIRPLGVVILGAGASSRMGRPKLLLPWGRSTVIGHLTSQWNDLGALQVAVVMRPGDAGLAAELDALGFPAQNRILNPHPERGMFSSIVCAAEWNGWRDGILQWAIALGDQPHLRMETLRQLVEFSGHNADAVCQPAFGHRLGHPVILPKTTFESLKHSPAENFKEFLKLSPARHVQVIIDDDDAPFLDMDTPEDYRNLSRQLSR